MLGKSSRPRPAISYRPQPFKGENGHEDGFLIWFTPDPFDAGAWSRARCERFLALDPCPINAGVMRIVPRPQCGCCGVTFRDDIRLIVNHPDPSRQIWRCGKHLDRLPCVIEGCGRTFRLDADDTYHMATCCRTHWKTAPHRSRAMVSLIRRKAKRRGWTRRLERLHTWAWWRCIRLIRHQLDGGLDLAEIEREFGITL